MADGAQILATQRSARAVAALSLVGTARWCLVDCESMSVVEDASERMRVSSALGGGRSISANELPDSFLDSYPREKGSRQRQQRAVFLP